MARSDENTVFCSFRMYLSNPQHLRIAKALKQLERDKTKSKNQFIADAVNTIWITRMLQKMVRII